MAQIFPRYANLYARGSIIASMVLLSFAAGAWGLYYWSPYVYGHNLNREQPVQFTHEHHVAGLGIDCRYCHFSVETSSFAGIPPVKVCMNCHSQLWTEEKILEPIREAWRTEKPVHWNRVHNLADFVYFNHSIHINKGMGCATCHGRVDQMPLMMQTQTMRMGWCVDCHRNPEKFVRPKAEVFAMDWVTTDAAQALQLVKEYKIESKTYCSTCHR